jgi:hypothetical protein
VSLAGDGSLDRNLDEMIDDGLVTMEKVRVLRYRAAKE